MKKNIGPIDRGIRIIAAIAILILYLTGQITGTAAIVLGAVAGILVLTGSISFCPMYIPFRISTLGKNKSRFEHK
jgi:hypothetical protein